MLTGLGCTYVELPPEVEVPGTFLPTHFGDPVQEACAVREGVVAWDVSSTASFEWRGRDATRALQRVFSNDLGSLKAGRGRYGLLLDEDGNVITDPIVFKMSDEHYFVTTGEGTHGDYYRRAASRLDVEIEWTTLEYPHVQVQGPKSRALLQGLTRFDLSSMKWFDITLERVALAGCPVLISRTGPTAELGFEVFYHRSDGETLWRALLDRGATPIGHDCIVNILKPELGSICIGVDYEPGQRTPYDLSMDRFVAIDKDVAFAGRERLMEIAARPPNRFVTLRLYEDDLPAWGSPVFAKGRDIGVATCSAPSPQFGPLGQAIVETASAHEGAEVEVRCDGRVYPATVARTPQYDPGRLRVRA
jgi:aminomethyltransferase